MLRYAIILLTCLSLFTACGSDTTPTENNTLAETIAAAEEQLGYNSTGTSCLAEKGKSLCDFLDPGLIEQYLPAGAELSGYEDTERGMLSSCGASVEHPTKTMKIGGEKFSMEVPAEYTISLNSINSYDDASKARERFAREYKTLTPEESKRMREQMEAALQDKVEAGELTQEQADLSKGFGKAIGKSVWVAVDGIGDLAVWGNALPDKESPTSGTLAVLVGDTQFSLNVDLLDSKDASKQAAIELAKAVLASCE